MDASITRQAKGPDARAEALVASYERAGYARVAPAILQPAEPFLDLSGEDIRKSLYLTTDAGGEELCLRPDLTIPVARDYLASSRAGQPAGFCYLGPVFRYRGSRPSEFLQAGIESFGRQDRAAADAEMLALALEATNAFGLTEVEIRTGDVALFIALMSAESARVLGGGASALDALAAGIRAAFLCGAIASLCAVVCALFIRKPDSAALAPPH